MRFFPRLTVRRTAPSSPRRAVTRARPRLEVLEDRCLLSGAPSVAYSSYLPAPAFAVAVDSAGEAFVTGATSTAAAGNPNPPGNSSAYVARLNAAGTGLLYLTYLGSNGYSTAGGIALDSAGDAYVVGWTTSTTFPTTANAAYPAFPGTNTEAGFVTELSPTGAILYFTYLPGPNLGYFNSTGGAIAVDSSGNIFVTGSAGSGLPVTAGAYQASYIGGAGNSNGEAYLVEINPSLSGPSAVVYASYLGGSVGDTGSGIAVDAAGNVTITGTTNSKNFPTTPGAVQSALNGSWDALVAKFNPSQSGAASLVYSTYLGGSGMDGWRSDNPGVINVMESGPAVAVDGSGIAYVAGTTTSTDFPTVGAFQTGLHTSKLSRSSVDAFVTKLNPTGTALVYSTYLGGNNLDGASAIAIDAAGNAYVTGWTQSTNFPTLIPTQAQKASGNDGWGYPNSDVFVAALNSTGNGLLFSTYLGGTSDDYGQAIALDSSGNMYVAGQTSSGFPTTSGAAQTTPGGGMVFKMTPVPNTTLSLTGLPTSITAGQSGTVTLTARDGSGNVLTGYTGTVHFSSSDPQAVLPADYPFTAADQGSHTFSVTLRTAGGQFVLVSDAVNGFGGSEGGITVVPAAAALLVLSAPANVTHGVAFSVTLTVQDAYGNVVTGYTGTIHFSSSDSTATLPKNYTFTAADAGVHTFTNVFMLKKRGTATLTATDIGNSDLTTTDSINVT
jgi:hypothetical protein